MQLAALAARDAEGAGKEAAVAAAAARRLLLALCLDPSLGLLPHAAGVGSSAEATASHDNAMAHSGAKAVPSAAFVHHPRSQSEREQLIVDMRISHSEREQLAVDLQMHLKALAVPSGFREGLLVLTHAFLRGAASLQATAGWRACCRACASRSPAHTLICWQPPLTRGPVSRPHTCLARLRLSRAASCGGWRSLRQLAAASRPPPPGRRPSWSAHGGELSPGAHRDITCQGFCASRKRAAQQALLSCSLLPLTDLPLIAGAKVRLR